MDETKGIRRRGREIRLLGHKPMGQRQDGEAAGFVAQRELARRSTSLGTVHHQQSLWMEQGRNRRADRFGTERSERSKYSCLRRMLCCLWKEASVDTELCSCSELKHEPQYHQKFEFLAQRLMVLSILALSFLIRLCKIRNEHFKE